MMRVRPALETDRPAIWRILEPTIRAGETWALPRDMTMDAALAYWFAPGHAVFVAEESGEVLGTYFLRANQSGGGAHVANCGYMTAPHAFGRGVARAMAEHSFAEARAKDFTAMQFNYVVASDERAVRLWHGVGFATVGRLPGAFRHPTLGPVDVLVMFRALG